MENPKGQDKHENPIASRLVRMYEAIQQAHEKARFSELSAEAQAAVEKMGQELGAVAKLDEKLETITRYVEEHADSEPDIVGLVFNLFDSIQVSKERKMSAAEYKAFYGDKLTRIDAILEQIQKRNQKSG